MEAHESSGNLAFNPQIKSRPINPEDVKAIIEQCDQNGGRFKKDPSSPLRSPPSSDKVVLPDEYDRDGHGHNIQAKIDPHRLADPNENIDSIIVEVIKTKYGAGTAEFPVSAEVGDLPKPEKPENKQASESLDSPHERDKTEHSDPKLVMHEIVTDLFEGKLYHVDLALPQEPQGADDTASRGDSDISLALRVLEVLCGDGVWCTQLLLKHPNWIAEGIDRVASSAWGQLTSVAELLSTTSLEDTSAVGKDAKNGKDEGPDVNKPRFAVTPIPCITGLPVPVQTYDFIHGMDIFATTHDWKLLLDDLHKILKLGGVIELIELDPRPRSLCAGGFLQLTEEGSEPPYGKSAAAIFPEILDDRLKEALDPNLLQEFSPWMCYVLRSVGCSSMPECIYATELKSWVEASGFCQVKEQIIKIPVGDWMEDQKLKRLGKRMLKLLSGQVKNKLDLNTICRDEYDSILEDMVDSENRAYLNLHVVTGRRPDFPRIGDLMPDSTRYRIAGAANRDHLMSCDRTFSWKAVGKHSS